VNSTRHYNEMGKHFTIRYGLTVDDAGFSPEHILRRLGGPRTA